MRRRRPRERGQGRGKGPTDDGASLAATLAVAPAARPSSQGPSNRFQLYAQPPPNSPDQPTALFSYSSHFQQQLTTVTSAAH
eukprot:15472450-Alexandrium_andersonii.AAC.1